MPKIAAAVVVAASIAAVPGVAHAARHRPPFDGYVYPAKNAAAKKRLARQRQVTDVVNDAQRHVFAVRPSCKPKLPTDGPATTDAPADPGFAAVIAALRRPPTAADAPPAGPGGRPVLATFATTHTDSVRTLTSAGGARATVLVAARQRHDFRLSAPCIAAERAWVHHLLRGRPHAVRAGALKLFEHIARDASKPAGDEPPTDGLYLFEQRPRGGGGGGGGATVKEFLARGMFFSSGGGPDAAGRHSTLTGVLPDGVASVTFEFPRIVDRGRNFRATVYPHAYTRTVKVADNLVSLTVPRDAADAFAPRMVWRGPDGTVVRVVRSPRGL